MSTLQPQAARIAGLAALGFGGMDPTAQVLIALIPVVAIALLGILSFFYLLWDYRKQRALIERGATPPRSTALDEKLLLIGIVSFFVGLGLTGFFLLRTGPADSLLGGLMPLAAGLGLIVYYFVIRRARG